MLSIHLDPEIEARLEHLAKLTGRTTEFYAQEAIREHLEDLEDVYLAAERLKTLSQTYSSKEVKRELDLQA